MAKEHLNSEKSKLITRRQFLQGSIVLGGVGAVSLISPDLVSAHTPTIPPANSILKPDKEIKYQPKTGEAEINKQSLIPRFIHELKSVVLSLGNKAEEAEGEIPHDDTLNTLTAAIVAGNLGREILKSIKTGHGMNYKSAAIMGSLEAARIAVLEVSGDHHAAEHDIAELAFSYPLIPVLGVLAEVASQTRGYLDRLYKEEKNNPVKNLISNAKTAVLPHAKEYSQLKHDAEELAYAEVRQVPHSLLNLENASIKECEDIYEQRREEVTRLVAGTTALSTVLAPALTTYVSASVASDSFEPILRALVETYYAKESVKSKSLGTSFDHQKALETAVDKANDRMNALDGFVNLSLAMAANTAGMAGIGDPPLIFSFFRDLDPIKHAIISGQGLAAHFALNTTMTTAWLARSELGFKSLEHPINYTKYTTEALVRVLGTGVSKDLREVAFDGSRGHLAQVINMLTADKRISSDTLNQLRTMMLNMPEPIIEFDVREFLNQKRDSLASLISSAPDSESYLLETQVATVEQLSEKFLSLLRVGSSEQLVESFNSIVSRISKENPAAATLLKNLGPIFNGDENPSSKLEQITEILYTIGPSGVVRAHAEAMAQFRGSHKVEEPSGLIGETANEVMGTLGTQVPTVPSIVHLVQKTLESKHNIREGSLNIDQVDAMTAEVLGFCAGMSMVADNVAAYLFGVSLLENIYRRAFPDYETNTELQYAANLLPLFVSIIAGSGTKIGNGANFQINKQRALIQNGELQFEKEQLTLGPSFGNVYSLAQIGLSLFAGYKYYETKTRQYRQSVE